MKRSTPTTPSARPRLVARVVQVAYHRNGITGTGFHAVHFVDVEGCHLLGIVARVDDEATGSVNVFVINPLSLGESEYRGDRFADELRAAVAAHEAK